MFELREFIERGTLTKCEACHYEPSPSSSVGHAFGRVIGLVVEAGGASTPAPTPPGVGGGARSLVTLAKSVRLRTALRGIAPRVGGPADGARVSATLTAKRIGRISIVTRKRVKAGTLRLRMKPTRRASGTLRRAGSVTAALRVSVKVPGQAATVETHKSGCGGELMTRRWAAGRLAGVRLDLGLRRSPVRCRADLTRDADRSRYRSTR